MYPINKIITTTVLGSRHLLYRVLERDGLYIYMRRIYPVIKYVQYGSERYKDIIGIQDGRKIYKYRMLINSNGDLLDENNRVFHTWNGYI